jgi:hypothetical protein
MIQLLKADDRGRANHGWLDTHYTFSFADYYDPDRMGFRSLRVMNEDRVAPGNGFPTHGHRDMEIITYVLEGALEHRDSMGNGSIIRPGNLQYMSAGTGVRHSEFNPSKEDAVHLYQIWILPDEQGLKPNYQELIVSETRRPGELRLVASPDGAEGSLRIHQDARLYLASLKPGQKVSHPLGSGRAAWLQVLRGKFNALGNGLIAGDGLAAEDVKELAGEAATDSEVLLFDLA